MRLFRSSGGRAATGRYRNGFRAAVAEGQRFVRPAHRAGQSIGQVRIGDADSLVIARLGKPDSSDAAMGKAWLFWISKNEAHDRTGIFTIRRMGTDDVSARVSQVLVSAPFFLTAGGVRTGDGLDAIRTAYPSLKQTAKLSGGTALYDESARGIAFVIGGDGGCKAIVVHGPGVAAQAITWP